MSKIFNLSNDSKNRFADTVDDIIDQIGKDCLLVYNTTSIEECPNCYYDINTERSSSVYKIGGPISFPQGSMCPVCNGAGRKSNTIESSERIVFRVVWNPKEWRKIKPDDVRLPNSIIMVKGKIQDYTKIQQAQYLILQQGTLGGSNTYRFKLLMEQIDPYSVVQGKYFKSFWERV